MIPIFVFQRRYILNIVIHCSHVCLCPQVYVVVLGRGAQRGGAVSVHHVDVGPGLDPKLAQIQVTVQSCAVQEGVQTPGHRPVGDVCPLQIVACGNNYSCNTLCLNVCLAKI